MYVKNSSHSTTHIKHINSLYFGQLQSIIPSAKIQQLSHLSKSFFLKKNARSKPCIHSSDGQSFLAESPLARTKGMAPKSPNSRMYFSRAGIPMPFCEVMMPSTTSSTTIAATTNAVFANLLITHSALNPVSGATFKSYFRLQSYNLQVQPFCTRKIFC